MNRTLKRFALASAVFLLFSTAGCSSSKVDPSASATPAPRPQVTASDKKAAPPAAWGYDGWALKIKPARGQGVIIREPASVQLVMDAWQTERLVVKNAVGSFKDKLSILDETGKERYAFDLASDGQLLLKAADGRVFRMPEYVYYMLENSLWSFGASLMEQDVEWQTDKGTAMLELELPRLIKAAMLPAFGYSMAYFGSYKIYGVNTDTRGVAKVYLLATVAGYDIDRGAFSPDYSYTTPMTLIFNSTGTNRWQLVDLKQPALTAMQSAATATPLVSASPGGDTAAPTPAPEQTSLQKVPIKGQALYTSIRTIFPFEVMSAVMDDMNGKTSQLDDMSQDIARQATEYLNTMGLSNLDVES